jgi:hypothetical protein
MSAKPEGPIDQLTLVRKIIAKCSDALDSAEAPKTTIGDLIRLFALEKELAGEVALREIKVRWVESLETEHAA